ncbi:Unknown protein [Striga hermonthica]|uniref:Reverse transcriptase zinc-binding domain-containing protein n=1 Tax=Striga hermonthica TaxID=68872 RepID=A0A9N7NDY9_STRHE|nr:Unknown protein [Striga hermonthica]
MDVDKICQQCGEAEETLERIMFGCIRAQRIWKLSGLSWDALRDKEEDFRKLWEAVITMDRGKCKKERIELTTYLLWWLWHTRNNWIFQNEWKPKKDIAEGAIREWREFTIFNGTGVEEEE